MMIDALHLDIRGEGPTLVLVHGWGFHAGIWESLAERLTTHFRVVCVDLPGHGHSALDFSGPVSGPVSGLASGYGLEPMVEAVVRRIDTPATWVGWSLGALFALRAAIDHPERVRALVTVAGTPCFTTRDDWPHGMSAAVIDRFGEELTADWQLTLRRFLALQGRGCDTKLLRRVRQVAMACLPSPDGLRIGLDLLRHQDLRAELPAIECPLLAIAGGQDNLVPVSGAQVWLQAIADTRLLVFPDAGHMPFLSHQAEVEQALRDFAR